MKGLRFERIGKGRHYNVVFHLGSTYVPVSDETVEELKNQSLLPSERFLEFLVDESDIPPISKIRSARN